jgi:hypothetical protein
VLEVLNTVLWQNKFLLFCFLETAIEAAVEVRGVVTDYVFREVIVLVFGTNVDIDLRTSELSSCHKLAVSWIKLR